MVVQNFNILQYITCNTCTFVELFWVPPEMPSGVNAIDKRIDINTD